MSFQDNQKISTNVSSPIGSSLEQTQESSPLLIKSITSDANLGAAKQPPSYTESNNQSALAKFYHTINPNNNSQANGRDDLLIEGLPIGSIFNFIVYFIGSHLLNIPGFLITYYVHCNHASRLGSIGGLGATFNFWGNQLRKYTLASKDVITECEYTFYLVSSCLMLIFGYSILIYSIIKFVRLRRAHFQLVNTEETGLSK